MDLDPSPSVADDVAGLDEPRMVGANGIDIAYETFGDPAQPPLLLVMGLGAQMLAWPDDLCRELADAGHHVIRFDNRDVGLSTHLRDAPAAPAARPRPAPAAARPYTIDDLADDAVGLLDALGSSGPTSSGASMGGFIARPMALRTPTRLRQPDADHDVDRLRRVGRPSRKVLLRLVRRRPAVDREAAVATTVDTFRLIGSAGYPWTRSHLRELASRSYDRAYDPTATCARCGRSPCSPTGRRTSPPSPPRPS
jgi:pimeloyl-ACP methyl ester carboxylesterase